MAKVTIRNEGITFEVPDGSQLMPYAKEHSAMLFGCGKGECGTCICNVVKGRENVNPRTVEEDRTLTKMQAYPSARLACKLVIRKGEVEIEY